MKVLVSICFLRPVCPLACEIVGAEPGSGGVILVPYLSAPARVWRETVEGYLKGVAAAERYDNLYACCLFFRPQPFAYFQIFIS